MSTQSRRLSAIAIIMIICFGVLLSGCGGGGSDAPAVLTSIKVTPSSLSLQVGESQAFTAVGEDQSGATMVIEPSWAVTGGIGSLDQPTGVQATFSAETVGTGTITATVGDISGSANVAVTPEPSVLARVEVTPDPHTLEAGETQEFSVTGYDQYDNTIAISGTASWSVTGEIGTVSPAEGLSTTFTADTAGLGTVAVSVDTFSDAAAVTVTAAPIYVPDDYLTIQGAINASSDGDIIIVRPGTYNEHITFVNKDVTLRSIDPADPAVVVGTIIDGSASPGSVVKFFANGSGAALEGFTITGSTQGTNIDSDYCGGGVLVQSSSPTIRNNRIINNVTGQKGGGIAVFGGTPLIEENLINGNSAGFMGGGLYLTGLAEGHSVSNNTISYNTCTNGAGITVERSNARLTNNIIEFNSAPSGGVGGGIYARLFSASITIDGCIIRENTAYRGGGIYLYGNLDSEITNTQIHNNTASEKGGGIYCLVTAPAAMCYLTSNILGNNSAASGGGIHVGYEAGLYAGNLTGSGNTFSNNAQYAIVVASGAYWTDEGNNTFVGNVPGDIQP